MFVGPSLVFLLSQQQTVLIITLGHCGTDIMTLRGKKKGTSLEFKLLRPFCSSDEGEKKKFAWCVVSYEYHQSWYDVAHGSCRCTSVSSNWIWMFSPVEYLLSEMTIVTQAYSKTQPQSSICVYFFFFFLMHWKKYLDLGDCKFHWMCLLLSC